jgi:mannose/cellobiose epimerase-like protein (N-acyl-D-glucosamine 2-epimerase family)
LASETHRWDDKTTVLSHARSARAWLLERMLPLWTSAGFDETTGQFVEALDAGGRPLALPRRALVQARQMVVCCAGGRLGWRGPWAERAAAAGDALLARGLNEEGDWIYSFDNAGDPADVRTDLYTQAFVILGLAEAGRALAREDFVAAAAATRRRLQIAWRHPRGGYREGEITPHAGRQNPHMHLLESFLALYAATRAAEDLTAASAVAELFVQTMLADGDRVPEEFDAEWRPIEARGAAPGHHFEWAWLLERLRLAGGQDRSATAQALAGFGERFGVDAAGFAIDAIALDGSVRSATARLWPQAERLKAALAGLGPDPVKAATEARQALSAYVDVPVAGVWLDLRVSDGEFESGPAPASSGYHLVGAIEAFLQSTTPSQ